MRLFNLLKNIILAIKNISNKYYYTTASGVTGTYRTTFTVCTLKDLPVGTYLILGFVGANVGTTTIMAASIRAVENCTIPVNGGSARTTGEAGGGCAVWAIAEVTGGSGKLELTTYRYYSGTIGYDGRFAAIRLI